MNSKEIDRMLQHGNDIITSKIFKDLIKDHEDRKDKMFKLYKEYDGEVPILSREDLPLDQSWKSNNKIPNDFRGMIIDQGLAYTFGLPLNLDLDASIKDNEKIKTLLKDFKTENKIDDLDYTTGFFAGICGYAVRLLYINEEGTLKVMNIKPWEALFVQSQTIDEIQYAMIYYDVEVIDISTDNKMTVKYVEWYDKSNVYYYKEREPGSYNFFPDPDATRPKQPHGFTGVPVVKYKNNDAEKGDFEMVTELVDAFDRVISDAQNEIEDYRNAYMIFKGIKPDAQVIRDAKNTGAFGSDDKDFDINFLTKELSGEFSENQKKTLNENIYKMSKRVDMSDESFSGSGQSGESRKWKLLALENDATIKEKKFRTANTEMYKLAESYWVIRKLVSKGFYLLITFQFVRNLPVDLEYYGKIVTALWGKLSQKTIYSLLPFIEDAQLEIEAKEEEDQAGLDKIAESLAKAEQNNPNPDNTGNPQV